MAFDHKAAWCMMSIIFEDHVMKLIIEVGMSTQTSHGLLTLFASYSFVGRQSVKMVSVPNLFTDHTGTSDHGSNTRLLLLLYEREMEKAVNAAMVMRQQLISRKGNLNLCRFVRMTAASSPGYMGPLSSTTGIPTTTTRTTTRTRTTTSTTTASAEDVIQSFELAHRLDGLEKPTVWHEFTPLSLLHESVNLGQGFPDWDPPEFVQQAMIQSVRERRANQYARSYAHLPLAEALVEDYSNHRWNNVDMEDLDPTTQVATTVGCTSALYCALQGLLNPGDEVILLEPSFDIYPAQVRIAGGTCVYVPLRPTLKEDHIEEQEEEDSTTPSRATTMENASAVFQLDMNELEAAITDRTKVILLNTPHVCTKQQTTRACVLCVVFVSWSYYFGHRLSGCAVGMKTRMLTECGVPSCSGSHVCCFVSPPLSMCFGSCVVFVCVLLSCTLFLSLFPLLYPCFGSCVCVCVSSK